MKNVNFEDFNNRFPLFPEYRLTLRLILSGVGTGTGSGNVLIYDFTNNNTLELTVLVTLNWLAQLLGHRDN